MKKIKNTEKQQIKKEPMSLKTKAMMIGAGGFAVLVMIILMIIESQRGKISIINDTDLKLEYVKAYFVDAEGPVNDETSFEPVEQGEKATQKLEAINLLGRQANLEIRFKFENYDYKLFVDAGYFNDNFLGNIKIEFKPAEDGLLRMKVKATNGLLPSTLMQCDEVYDVNYKEGYIAE